MKNSLAQKLNKFKTSPLIIGLAVIEVIILICVSTYAWFIFADNNKVYSDVISVEPDSGLEIDFSDANENDYINIWNYLNEFEFEPITSLDGRNLFVPTSGTFNAMASNPDTPVSPEGPGESQTDFFIYFDVTGSSWTSVYVECDYTANSGAPNRRLQMTRISADSNVFYINLADLASRFNFSALSFLRFHHYASDSGNENMTVQFNRESNNIIEKGYLYSFDLSSGSAKEGFYNNGNGMLLDTTPVIYTGPFPDVGGGGTGGSGSGDGSGAISDSGSIKFREATVNDMNSKYINIDFTLTNTKENTTEPMPVYLSSKSFFKLYDPETKNSIVSKALRIAFYQNDAASGKVTSSLITSGTSSDSNNTTVFFNNTVGWDTPYAYVWNDATQEKPTNDKYDGSFPGLEMTPISGDLYYYTFDSVYDRIIFSNGSTSYQTVDITPQDGYIYTLGNRNNENKYEYSCVDYMTDANKGTYPVISPGVSTGFQRPYAPVTEIDNSTGKPEVVVPAFASSIDDYNYGITPLFYVAPNQTLSLSMIIWLEGTDPDCTEDVYAGKSIDMNLVFATNDSDEQTYTYKFLDKTKENWIEDSIEIAAGVSFDPVMQLYDAESGKGYKMTVSNDTEGKPTIWTCTAPVELNDSEHITFRRVNPMNEDEVWNYWDTYGFDGINGAVTSNTVTFTAFADGAPTNATKDPNTSYQPSAPDKSCGGLWGDHNVEILVVYDGTKNQWIDETNPVKDGYSGALTIKYTYNDQEVEYKASGSGQSFYYFVIPECIKTGTDISFSRYYNYNTKFGFNSPNNSLVYHRSWNAGKYEGSFYEISETYNGTDYCYWGDDIHYVQVNEYKQKTDSDEFSTKFDSDSSHMQIRYTDSDGDHFYSYLFKNSAMKGSHMLGYASVIPSGSDYVKYRVERCKMNDPDVLYNATDTQTINSTSKSSYYSNTVVDNICVLQHFKYTVYYKKTVGEAVPKLHQFLGTNSSENKTVEMEYDSTKGLYFVDWNISLYDKFEIHETIPNTTTTAYLIPNNNWSTTNRYSLYLIDTQKWKSATHVGKGIYKVEGIADDTKIIWGRMNNGNSTNDWSNCWDQSTDIEFDKDNPITRIVKDQWGSNSGASCTFGNAFKSHTWGKDSTEATTFNGVQYTFDSIDYNGGQHRLSLSQSSVSGVDSKESVKSELFNNSDDLWN